MKTHYYVCKHVNAGAPPAYINEPTVYKGDSYASLMDTAPAPPPVKQAYAACKRGCCDHFHSTTKAKYEALKVV